MKRLSSKLTYANVVSTLCLFLLVGGGAAFAASQLPKNSVGAKQLKKNAVTAAKIKNGAVTGAKLKLSSIGTVPSASTANTAGTATTANNANALGGKAASAFAASTVIRSASVFGKGTLIPELSDGIAQANVSHPTTGLYCFNGLNPAPKTAVAQLAFEATNGAEIFVQVNPTLGGCAGSQIAVATEKIGVGFEDNRFEMIVH
jgi:hypothetical protein